MHEGYSAQNQYYKLRSKVGIDTCPPQVKTVTQALASQAKPSVIGGRRPFACKTHLKVVQRHESLAFKVFVIQLDHLRRWRVGAFFHREATTKPVGQKNKRHFRLRMQLMQPLQQRLWIPDGGTWLGNSTAVSHITVCATKVIFENLHARLFLEIAYLLLTGVWATATPFGAFRASFSC